MEKELFEKDDIKTYNLMVAFVKKLKEKGKLIETEIHNHFPTSAGETIQIWKYGKHKYKLIYKDLLTFPRGKELVKVIRLD
jgi:hypothetical protein